MTRLLVLGLLTEKPMSGYDIQQTLAERDVERWSGVQVGSIYHALKKLEQEGYIDIESVENTGHRQKATYKITAKGQKHLQSLIGNALHSPAFSLPVNFYSALSNIDKLSREEITASLVRQKEILQKEYVAFQKGLDAKSAAMHGDIVAKLTLENILSLICMQEQFVDQLLLLYRP